MTFAESCRRKPWIRPSGYRVVHGRGLARKLHILEKQLSNGKQTAFFQKLQKQICVAENGVYFRLRKEIFGIDPWIIAVHFREAVS